MVFVLAVQCVIFTLTYLLFERASVLFHTMDKILEVWTAGNAVEKASDDHYDVAASSGIRHEEL